MSITKLERIKILAEQIKKSIAQHRQQSSRKQPVIIARIRVPS